MGVSHLSNVSSFLIFSKDLKYHSFLNQYDIGRRGCACGGLCEVEVALTILKLTQLGGRAGTSKYRDACASKNINGYCKSSYWTKEELFCEGICLICPCTTPGP